ncbi:DUF4344 domain-containing metallopeptidase [Nonomuraea sp. NPDC050556]|uniref:DUF4344 domain-containing metallopeptidase n=1 Tax=Nonomuraea sp. NPDC050556 TaxID=3364369 RepID=UPI0037A0C2FC
MKSPLFVVGLLALALCACGNGPQKAMGTPSPSGSQASGQAGGQAVPSPTTTFSFTAAYEQPTDKKLLGAEKLMREGKLVQQWAEVTNAGFIPPVNVPVVAKQCDTVNAFYSPDEKSITMCYEMTDYLQDLFAKPEQGEAAPSASEVDDSVAGALNGIYYHELGHALIDLYDLPTTGKEEDAVDQLSALVMIGNAEDNQDYRDIISTIEAWGRMSQESETGPLDQGVFADEHSLSGQRYYNMMCYLYGSNHNAFLPLVADGELPVGRAMRCEDEYNKMARAWGTLLAPHMRTDPPSPVPTTTPSSTATEQPTDAGQSTG